jgi:hypothetical protein
MKRTIVNLLVDLAAAALFLGMMATGYILWFALPPGTNKSLSLWGLIRHNWGSVHAWISFGLLGTLFLHVCLHWQWVVSVVGKRLRWEQAPRAGHWPSGLLTFLAVAALLGVFAWAAQTGRREITDPGEFGVCPPDGGPRKGAARALAGAPSPETTPPVEFWKDVYPVLEESCLACHGPRTQRGGFRVDRPEDFFGTAGKPALVVPGQSAQSPLIAIVSGLKKDIPRLNVHRLPEKDVAVLKAWIDAGAEWRPKGR